MSMTWLAMMLVVFPGARNEPGKPVKIVIDTIEALQQPIKDFRCEFEGSIRYQGGLATVQGRPLGADGLEQTFSGTFVWRQGDTYHDCFHRMEPNHNLGNRSRGFCACAVELMAFS